MALIQAYSLTLDTLHTDIYGMIVSRLDVKDALSLFATNNTLNEINNYEWIWRLLLKRDYTHIIPLLDAKKSNIEVYKELTFTYPSTFGYKRDDGREASVITNTNDGRLRLSRAIGYIITDQSIQRWPWVSEIFDLKVAYYEIEVVEGQGCIGFGQFNYTRNNAVGWNLHSIGFHSDDAGKFHGNSVWKHSFTYENKNRNLGPGCTIGELMFLFDEI